MYLKSLELMGFKSFAKKEILTFKTAVTGIVGPNGSGKSNTAEAFRFVLGEQSMKSLRGKRGEDLIWSGNDNSPRANRASVKAIFDNSKRIFNIDFDEVSVERAVGRDGVNEYSINESEVRLKDILELLAQANIGSSGHHIISQGEADRVLSANIKERKSMIQDALGLKVYEYKREESRRKLQKTEENIEKSESLRREIAPHIRFLKKQVEKMDKAIEVKNRLADLYREYLKREKLYIDFHKKNLILDREPLIHKKNNLEEAMKKARATLESSSTRDVKSESLLNLEKEIEKVRREKQELERELGKIEGELFGNSRIIQSEKIKTQNSEVNVSLSEVEKLLQEVFSGTEETDNFESLKNILKDIKEKLWNFIEKNKGVAVVSIVKDLEEKNTELSRAKQSLEEKIEAEEKKLRELDSQYREVKQHIEAEKDSERTAEREIFRIASEETTVNAELSLLRNKEERLNREEEEFLREAREAVALMGNLISGFVSLEINEKEVQEEERRYQEERRREVEKMKIRLEELGASGGEEVMKEYNDAIERDAFLEKELTDLRVSSEALQKIIVDLEEKLHIEFKEGVRKINESFQSFFSLMFGGGTARLEVLEQHKNNTEDFEGASEEMPETESGIDVHVSLPKKRIKGLVMLSGGERALTSIALLFAISQVNPPPFIILDETDAALDEANSKKYGDMIESLSKYSQLILITHNRETMSRAGVIYGVTMGSNGVSKLLSIDFDEAQAVAK